MDPFSITVSALGITEFAICSIYHLCGLTNSLAESKEVVQYVALTLEAVQRPLGAIKELNFSDSATYTAAKEDLEKNGVAKAVNECGQACDDFAEKLKRCTKHSNSKKMSIRDRLSQLAYGIKKASIHSEHRFNPASPLFNLLSIVQLRSNHTSKTDHENLNQRLQTLEKAVQEHTDLIKSQQEEAQKRKEELKEEPEDEENGGAQRTLAIREVEVRSRLLEADQASSGVVSSQLRSVRPGEWQHIQFNAFG